VTPKERQRLLKFGAKLGKAIRQLVTIVTPDSFLRWIREDKRSKQKFTKPAKRGRPRTREEIRKLIILLARKTLGAMRGSSRTQKVGASQDYQKHRPQPS